MIGVHDGDAILIAQKLGFQRGIAVGISSGANLVGAIKVQNALGVDAVVVTVFADDNKEYLTTDLLRFEAARAGYISLDTELLGVRAFKRVCMTCCDPENCIEAASRDALATPQLPPCPRRQ